MESGQTVYEVSVRVRQKRFKRERTVNIASVEGSASV